MLNAFYQSFKKNILNTTIKQGLLFSLFSFVNNGLNFILLLVLASLFTTTDYGFLNLYTILIVLVSFVISLNTQSLVSVEFFSLTRQKIAEIITGVLIISTILLPILIIVVLLIPKILDFNNTYKVLGLLYCYFNIFYIVLLDIWRLEEKITRYGFYTLLYVSFNFISTVVLVKYYGFGWSGRVYSQFAVSVLFFLISFYFLLKNKYIKLGIPKKEIFMSAIKFGLPLIPHSISTWIRQSFDRYVISSYYSIAIVGVFSLSFNLSSIIHMIGFAFNATNSVFIYKQLNSINNTQNIVEIVAKLRKQTNYMTVFFLIITLLLIMSCYIFVPVFFTKYTGSLYYIVPLCFSAMFQCFYYLYVNYLFYFKKTKELMYITLSISLFHLTLSILLTKYSIMYTAIICMISNFIIFISVFFYSKKIFPLNCKL